MFKKSLLTLPALLLPMVAFAGLTPVIVESIGTAVVVAPAPVVAAIPPAPPAPVAIDTTDEARRKALLGTWQAIDSPTATQINGEATFTTDGKATGYTTATYVYNDGYTSDVKVSLDFKWKLENGIITLDHFLSDPPGFIKKTHHKRFEIQSMTNDNMILKDLADGEEVYRRRKPG